MFSKPLVLAGSLLALLFAASPAPAAGVPTGAGATALADLNEASGAAVGNVAVSCFQFLPATLNLVNGDTAHWHFQDACGQNIVHTVTSSGSTLDPAQDRAKPEPTFQGRCFDSPVNQFLPDLNLHLAFVGVVVRDLGTTEPVPCPLDNSVDAGPVGVVPYNCRFHGVVNPAGFGMRGALVIGL